ncbi:MAG TPA: uracil-DNA glycosylase [Coleofasciculaceae cyanobacterium]
MANDQQINLFDQGGGADTPASLPDPEQIPASAMIPIPVGTYTSMDQMEVHCNRCSRCDLGKNRTHAVIYRGSLTAPIMIVGEGPGQQEDEQGKPFVGKSGQLLDKILQSVNLDVEQDVFICNVVKCRPPENRTPTTDEADACKGYLMEQIRMVNPPIILLTGATALRGLLGIKQGITKVRGQWIEQDHRLYMPIFHPAYLLRNQSREKGSPKWLMWQDIQAVKQKVDELRGE